MKNEDIDEMDLPTLAWHISALLLSNGVREVPVVGEEMIPAFRKILKGLLQIIPERKYEHH